VSKSARNRQESLRDFVDLCDRVGFHLEPFQKKIAGALLGPEREKLITLPRKNGKSRVVGTFASWHLLPLQRPQPRAALGGSRLVGPQRAFEAIGRDPSVHRLEQHRA
jgi:phage terminase large subunit-like protein